MFSVPVALIVFRRPQHTARVLAAIARIKPERLFVIADGPRADKPEEKQLCAQTRALVDRIDWPCEVVKHYAEVNLGCGRRPASGITWLFEQVERAIILEDDCVPHPTFFRFCEEMLDRYQNDERVMTIGGTNAQPAEFFGRQRFSYDFVNVASCWGWATWRRAWQHFDFEMKAWPALRPTTWLSDLLHDEPAAQFYARAFEHCYGAVTVGNSYTWDLQWQLACFQRQGLYIMPRGNLVSNIGFGTGATHTKTVDSVTADVPLAPMRFPLRHPPAVALNRQLDLRRCQQVTTGVYSRAGNSWHRRIAKRLRASLARPVRLAWAQLRGTSS